MLNDTSESSYVIKIFENTNSVDSAIKFIKNVLIGLKDQEKFNLLSKLECWRILIVLALSDEE